MNKAILWKLLIAILIILLPVRIFAAVGFISTVDSTGDVGEYTSIALDSSSNPHISYLDYSNFDLKYARYNGSSWEIETIDSTGDVGRHTSLALDSSGNPHISYQDDSNNDLKYAHYNGSSWEIETIDSTGIVGAYTSLALDSSGNPHIGYQDYSNFDLKYARYNSSSWEIETIDSTGNVGWNISLALDSGSNPHISYSGGGLKYAWYDGTWHTETVDSSGGYISLALDSSGNPHISYQAGSTLDLKYACYNDSSWEIETVDSVGRVGFDTSLALDSGGNPHISYCNDSNGDLKYARYNGSSWEIETIDSTGDAGSWSSRSWTSLALDSSGNSHISYYDDSNNDLKFAHECQSDFDCDGVLDSDDNCPASFNPGQADNDNDSVGDVCDNCLSFPNHDQEDLDEDGVGDVCDNCPEDDNPDQEDYDSDSIGDVCDLDYDGDGICNPGQSDPSCNGIDNCPTIFNPDQADMDSDGRGDVCDDLPYIVNPIPITGGRCSSEYDYNDFECCSWGGVVCCSDPTRFMVGHEWSSAECGFFWNFYCDCQGNRTALIEFDISALDGLFLRAQIDASLSLAVKNGNLHSNQCVALYNMQDANENGFIEAADEDTIEIIAEICEDLQPEDSITIDVTSAIEHDLFDPDQTDFSGFVLKSYNSIEFYDHTDPVNAPKLRIIDMRDCEGNFDCDEDVDGNDVATFKTDFGRNQFNNPCENSDPCKGDFDCDHDCDGTDAAKFKEDFGRSSFNNPCPACEVGEWCSYPLP